MKIVLNLNDEVKKNLNDVDHVFFFDNDESSLLLSEVLKHPDGRTGNTFDREVGMKSFKGHTAQISIYKMPNGKFCAVAYPCSVKVNYESFSSDMHKLFKFVDRRFFSSNSYSFFLYCLNNGYTSPIKIKSK
jgi:hypothetical protein